MPHGWEDTTSYRQGDTEQKPTNWTIGYGDLKITIVWDHLYAPNDWSMHCYELNFNTHSLGVKSLNAAKKKALRVVKAHLMSLLNDLFAINENGGV